MNVRMGRRAVVRGVIRPAGSTVALQIRRGNRWVTLDRDRTNARGAYVLRDRQRRPLSARARVMVSRGPSGSRRIGRLNVYRHALASWYGPGFYGRRDRAAAGASATPQLGVAHKTLPCGTRVTLRHRGRVVRVPVIDRGPYAGRARVRPDRGDRPAPEVQGPRARSTTHASRRPSRGVACLACSGASRTSTSTPSTRGRAPAPPRARGQARVVAGSGRGR